MTAIVWVAIALTGAIVSAWNTLDAWADLGALGSLSNGRRIIALGWVRREGIRLIIQVSWTAIGILALPQPEPKLTLVVVILIGTNLLLLISTILDARDRLALRRIIN